MAKREKKRGGRRPEWPRPSASALGKDTLGYWAVQYAQWLRVRNYSEGTVLVRAMYLQHFAAWCEARSLYYPTEITREIVERYQSSLYHHRKDDGRPLSFRAQLARLVSVRVYFKWLARQRVVPLSPASELELPKVPYHVPRTVLTALEVEVVMRLPNINDPLGLRDRAMLELLYCTAIRRGEIAELSVYDLDIDRCVLLIRDGKGKRDRVVPVGERALLWVQKYLADGRPEIVMPNDEGKLFLTHTGEPLTKERTSMIAREYILLADLGKRGACHLFRHTAATLMLENGADIRFIQQLLGHVKLETTAVYTQVSIHKLKEVHALTHPGARLSPLMAAAAEEPSLAASSADGAGDAASALHEALDAESEDEDDGV